MPKGLIKDDGCIAATAPRFLEDLGFSVRDDLRGLALTSFWHPPERPAVQDALRRARAGEEMRLKLDLSYIHERAGSRTVALSPSDIDGMVQIRLAPGP
ncbi:PAS domain-containing protein [Jannaschia donghaensis]|uniref:PAS fold protein n=1 Tax=Jannaschia donghaensis TaxID=420998 RepID=A0A0M6YFK0_9RHOB|nr:PAS domain-containing protein [Jannaschia donghaensis]CTQ48720.1 hypothetical protein JDO7802_00724 [Jannaschia donghaensis]